MSIKLKLSALISAVVILILILNLLVFSVYTRGQQDAVPEQQLQAAAEQIRLSMAPTIRTFYFLDTGLSERLRAASIGAKGLLGPSLTDISQDNLVEARDKLHLDALSLLPEELSYGEVETVLTTDAAGTPSVRSSLETRIVTDLLTDRYTIVPRGTSIADYWSDTVFGADGRLQVQAKLLL